MHFFRRNVHGKDSLDERNQNNYRAELLAGQGQVVRRFG